MSNAIKTNYMESPNLGYSEYFVKSKTDLPAISPKSGDRAIVADEGKIYICVTQGSWEKFGNTTSSSSVTIETTINSESTNDDVAGAAAVWDLVEDRQTTIVTTIDNTSTNEVAAGAQAVWELVQNIGTTIDTTIDSNSTNLDAAGAKAVWNLFDSVEHINILSGNQTINLTELNYGIYHLQGNITVIAYTNYTQTEHYKLSGGYLFPRSRNGKKFGSYIFIGSYKPQNMITGNYQGILISGGVSGVEGEQWYPVPTILENKEDKVTTIDSSSTDVQYPSAKAVYDFVTTAISAVVQVQEDAVIPGGKS